MAANIDAEIEVLRKICKHALTIDRLRGDAYILNYLTKDPDTNESTWLQIGHFEDDLDLGIEYDHHYALNYEFSSQCGSQKIQEAAYRNSVKDVVSFLINNQLVDYDRMAMLLVHNGYSILHTPEPSVVVAGPFMGRWQTDGYSGSINGDFDNLILAPSLKEAILKAWERFGLLEKEEN